MAGKSGSPFVLYLVPETMIFGVRQIKESIPSLAELGGHQLYPTDPAVGTSGTAGTPTPSNSLQSLFKIGDQPS